MSTDKLWKKYIIQQVQSNGESRPAVQSLLSYKNHELVSCEATPIRVLFKTSASEVTGLFLGPRYQISIHVCVSYPPPSVILSRQKIFLGSKMAKTPPQATISCLINTDPPAQIQLATSWDIDGQTSLISPLTPETAQRMARDQPSIYWGEILR